ncbi:MAG: hypothetical protein A3D74_00965 [Candidatus Levybacteria bacterium RIFCSPHIGHO2_02_FULL_37_13]|nr:MAG: hypothetical protein A3D74_00965 [Candidatus Levybacteria bacterium RIFCSPHIGHO2_02_FULL_37_13]OGH39361.1 MAG: hypothetical protein A3B41_03085 [Candidatus Levybacteria bacterium RIFCSPLOWO2_01_FULL_37_26]
MKPLKILFLVGILAILAWVVSPTLAAPFQRMKAPNLEWVEETFVDYSHAGPGPHPTTESNNFHLTQGGIKWFGGGTVKYEISGVEDVTGGNTAIETAEATLDGFVTTRTFIRDDASPTANLCGGNNRVVWASIDGADGVLATASVCRNVATKEIAGFAVTLDTGESWATDGSSSSFDVENAAVHEFLHVGGLDHTNAPKDGCLTSYRFAGLGETQKRTLGLGDKLGMDTLYSTGDTSSGPGCGF